MKKSVLPILGLLLLVIISGIVVPTIGINLSKTNDEIIDVSGSNLDETIAPLVIAREHISSNSGPPILTSDGGGLNSSVHEGKDPKEDITRETLLPVENPADVLPPEIFPVVGGSEERRILVRAKEPKPSIILEESVLYSQYRFFVGKVWHDPLGVGRSMSAEFVAVPNNIGGLGSDDWVAFLPVNLAYGHASDHVWIQFAIMFEPSGNVDFYVEQNNYNGGDDYDYGTFWNGRMWSTAYSWPQNIGVPYTVGHAYSFQCFVVPDETNQVEVAIWDHTTDAMWTHVIHVPSTDVLYWPYQGGFSPAATVEGVVGTSVTSLTNFPYFEFDIINGMKEVYGTMWVNPPSGVDQFLSARADSCWRWAAVSSSSKIPNPIVQSVSYPSSISLGESASIDISVRNNGGTASWMTIAVSFPTNPPTSAISIDYGGTSVGDPKIWGPGEKVSFLYGFLAKTWEYKVTLSYPLVEGSSSWSSGTNKHLKVIVTPPSTGSFPFYVKTVAAYDIYAIDWDPDLSASSVRDQQSEYTYSYTIGVGVSPSSISVNVNPDLVFLGGGTTISGSITSSTPGDKTGTVYLQYSTNNANWNNIGSTTSSSGGAYSYWWEPSSTGTFYVRSYWNGNSQYGGATSGSFYPFIVKTSGGNLDDHCMCKGVQSEDPWDPIERTNVFYTDDPKAHSWLKFVDIYDGPHYVHWDWYDPDGVHWTWDSTIPAPPPGEYWVWYKKSSNLGPLHFADSKLGRAFTTKVYYDGNLVVTETWTVIKHDSSITVSLSSNSITYGQSVTIDSQLSPSFSDGTTTLQYSTDGVNWNNIAAGTPSNGHYSRSWKPPAVGTYYVRAKWSGNLNYYGSTSSTKTLTVDKAATTLTTTLSSTPITYGASVTITASMSPQLQGKTVTIQYSLDNSNWYDLSSGTTNAAGEYAFSWTPAVGSYYIRSAWGGDTNYYGATSSSQPLTVTKASTLTSCSVSSNSIEYGQSVEVTGTVNAPVNSGTMTLEYSVDEIVWDLISDGSPISGSYSHIWVPPAIETFHIRASWSGDNNYIGSTSSSLVVTVTPPECDVIFYTDPAGSGFNVTFQGQTFHNDTLGTFDYGTSGSATANCPVGWEFDHWITTDNVAVSDVNVNPTVVTITCGGTLKAVFNLTECEVTFLTDPADPGYFISFEGQDYFDGDVGVFPYDTSGAISATGPVGWVFDHWETSGNVEIVDETLTITCGGIVTAVFVTEEYTLTVNIEGSGSVCLNNTGPYYYGDFVELTANADAGWVFSEWSEDLTGSANPETITMDANKVVNATFVMEEYTLTVNVIGDGTVDLNATGPYYYGDVVELTANPDLGWSFSGWSVDLSGSINPETIVMDGDKTVNATFTEIPSASNGYLVVRGYNNGIYYRLYNSTSSSWGSWRRLPGATCDSPAATVCQNELHIVVRGMDGSSLWHGYVNLADNTFIGWTRLSGWTPSAPTLTSNGTVLGLVVRGGDNRIYYRTYSFSPRGWADWNVIPTGTTCDGPAAAMFGSDLHIVVRGFSATDVYGNYSMWHVIVEPNVGVVRGWVRISGSTQSKPSLAANQTANELYLVVRGLDNRIYWRIYDAPPTDSWGSWVALPTGSTCDGPGATIADNKLHVVVRGSDGYTLWHRYYDFLTGIYSDWKKLSGSTPSLPTLAS